MSSKRRRRWKDCERKIRHATESEALRAVRLMPRRDGHIRPYKCPWCGGWHNGHARTRVHVRGKFKRAIFTALMALWMAPASVRAVDATFAVILDGVRIADAQIAVSEALDNAPPTVPAVYRPGNEAELVDGRTYTIEIRIAAPDGLGPVQQAIFQLRRAAGAQPNPQEGAR